MRALTSVFGSAVTTVIQTVVSAVLLLVLYRLLLNMLGAPTLGIWSIVLATTSVSRMGDLGLSGSVVRFVAKYRARGDLMTATAVIQTGSISLAVAFSCFLLLGYPLGRWLLSFVVPAASLLQAQQLFPFALGSMWLTVQASVFQSSLDACQRIDIRNGVTVASNVLLVLLVLLFVPRFGLIALGYIQIVQAGALAVAAWLFLRREIPALPLIPSRWSRERFREMLSYGVNFQVVGLANILFDFVTKALLSRFSGLSDVAYYDMANRMVLQIRSLLVSANQVTVPFLAAAHERTPEGFRGLYERSYATLSFIALPLFGATLALVPTIAILWIGAPQPTFILFAVLLTFGWGLNSLNAPAYFANLATGELRWNTIGHVVIGILNILLGLLLGRIWGGAGVVTAWIIALVTGSALIVVRFHRAHHLPFRLLAPKQQLPLAVAVMLAVVISWLSFTLLPSDQGRYVVGAAMLATIAILFPTIWAHPIRPTLTQALLSLRSAN